jgi:hypothetical protein
MNQASLIRTGLQRAGIDLEELEKEELERLAAERKAARDRQIQRRADREQRIEENYYLEGLRLFEAGSITVRIDGKYAKPKTIKCVSCGGTGPEIIGDLLRAAAREAKSHKGSGNRGWSTLRSFNGLTKCSSCGNSIPVRLLIEPSEG